MMTRKSIVLSILAAASLAAQSVPQAAVSKAQPPAVVSEDSAPAGDYQLGPGDLLAISVFGVDELDQLVRIGSTGLISLPLAGKLSVEALTVEELESRIAERLISQRLVRDPQVRVLVKEYRSKPIYVMGAVNQPGQFMIRQKLRLIDALTLAGGLDSKKAGETILLRRAGMREIELQKDLNSANAPEVETETINLKALFEGADPSLNLLLKAGDVVQVPERKIQVYYVIGEVTSAGAFEMPADSKQTLLLSQALARAGGPAKTAKIKNGMLVRYENGGERSEMAVDFHAILRGEKKDLVVQPNDIIFIPGSTLKTLGMALVQNAPWTLSNAVIFRLP